MKVTRYESGRNTVPRYSGRAPARPKKAIEAAIEARRRRYIRLQCGHMTTPDVDELYRFHSFPRNKHYCETCGGWKKSLPAYVPPPISDEPLF